MTYGQVQHILSRIAATSICTWAATAPRRVRGPQPFVVVQPWMVIALCTVGGVAPGWEQKRGGLLPGAAKRLVLVTRKSLTHWSGAAQSASDGAPARLRFCPRSIAVLV